MCLHIIKCLSCLNCFSLSPFNLPGVLRTDCHHVTSPLLRSLRFFRFPLRSEHCKTQGTRPIVSSPYFIIPRDFSSKYEFDLELDRTATNSPLGTCCGKLKEMCLLTFDFGLLLNETGIQEINVKKCLRPANSLVPTTPIQFCLVLFPSTSYISRLAVRYNSISQLNIIKASRKAPIQHRSSTVRTSSLATSRASHSKSIYNLQPSIKMKPSCTLPRLLLLFLALITLTTAIATQKPLSNHSKALLNLHNLQTEYSLRMDEHHKFWETRTADLEEILNSLASILYPSIHDIEGLTEITTKGRISMQVDEILLSNVSKKLEHDTNLLREAIEHEDPLLEAMMELLKDMKQEMRDLETWGINFMKRVERATEGFAGKRRF